MICKSMNMMGMIGSGIYREVASDVIYKNTNSINFTKYSSSELTGVSN